MSEAASAAPDAPVDTDAAAAVPPRRGARWLSRLAKTLLTLVGGLLLLATALGLLLDTDLGHRLILDRIAAIAPESGLRIRIGRLGGSIWGKTELRDVRLYDPEGLFAEAPAIDLEWEPLAWLTRRVAIQEVRSDLVIVHRLPKLEAARRRARGGRKYDLNIGRLDIAQLRFEEAVSGQRRTLRVAGEAEFRSGRALARLDATMRGGGDRLQLLLDAAPAQDRFDLDLRLDAPQGGVIARMTGAEQPLRLALSGDGSWTNWAGQAAFDLAGSRAGEFRLSAASGRYGVDGWLAPDAVLEGDWAVLGGARALVRAEGTLEDGLVDGSVAARTHAVRLMARGGVDVGEEAFRDVRVGVDLLRPELLVSGFSGRGLRGTALLNGPFEEARIAYRVVADRLQTDEAALEDVRATGSARLSGERLVLPLNGQVARVTGLGGGDFERILARLRLNASFLIQGNRVSAEDVVLVTDQLRARLGFGADLRSGRYAVQGAAALQGYDLNGVGLVDLRSELRAFGGPGTFSLAGQARGTVRRLDSDVIRAVAGGAPSIETGLVGGPGGLRLTNLRFSSAKLTLAGEAQRRSDGSLLLAMNGRHRDHGPVALRLDGPLARPRVGLRLADPGSSFSNVALEIVPANGGLSYSGSGLSPLGPFAARGSALLARGRPAAVRVAALSLSGATASGLLRPANGGVTGQLQFRGSLAGPMTFSRGAIGQRVEASMVASDARIGDIPIGSGRLEAAAEIGRGDDPAVAARLRFDGAADRLWAMAGIEQVSLSGPVSLSADVSGTLGEPAFTAGMRIDGGRLTSAATGTTIDGLDTQASFDGMRVEFQSFAGRTQGGGRVRGSGFYDLAGPMEVRMETEDALLVDRPSVRARVSGPVEIVSDGNGGTISGTLRASDATLRFRRSGRGGDGADEGGSPWRLALTLSGDRVTVRSGSLDSQWRAAVTVAGTLDAPAVTGEAELLRGSYSVLGQAFRFRSGRMVFAGENPPDPRLDIIAEAPGDAVPGGVRITGRVSRPEIGFAVPPAPPQQQPARRRGDALPAGEAPRRPRTRRRR